MLESLNQRDTLNVLANMMSGANFAALAAVLFTFIWRHDIGHKRLLWFSLLFYVAQMLKELSVARDIVFAQPTVESATFRLLCSCVQSVCLIYFLAVIADIVVTLRRSETIDRIVKHQERNKDQVARDTEHLAVQIKQDSGALLRRRQEEGDPDEHLHHDRDSRTSLDPASWGGDPGSKQVASRWARPHYPAQSQ